MELDLTMCRSTRSARSALRMDSCFRLRARKTSMACAPIRLFPSTKAWFLTRPKPRHTAICWIDGKCNVTQEFLFQRIMLRQRLALPKRGNTVFTWTTQKQYYFAHFTYLFSLIVLTTFGLSIILDTNRKSSSENGWVRKFLHRRLPGTNAV